MKITLTTPITDMTGLLRSELTCRDIVTAGDLLYAKRHSAGKTADEQSYALLARVCGLDMLDFEKLDLRDVAKIDAHLSEVTAPKA
jgi:hypothetical protein